MVIVLKKGFYLTLNFKGLFSGVLVGCLIFSFVLFLAFPEPVSTASGENTGYEKEKKQLIIVDPGHGGEDGGTASSQGVNEKDVNLEISLKLKYLLDLCGFETLMVRTEDRLIYSGSPVTMREKKASDLSNRLQISKENPDGIFLSIHQNYFTESKYWGAQVFYSPNNPDSQVLADLIQNAVITNIQQENTRKIKRSGKEIYILYHAEAPAVMVECGFMSNYSEALLLKDRGYQLKMSLSVIDGINNYLDSKGVI